MVSAQSARSITVENADIGSLVIYSDGDERFVCIPVSDQGKTTLLALNFRNHSGPGRSPMLLLGIGDRPCLSLGKASLDFDMSSLSHDPRTGNIFLSSNGAAIIGRTESGGSFSKQAWLLSTGERVVIDTILPSASIWAVGLVNSANAFESLLKFPIVES